MSTALAVPSSNDLAEWGDRKLDNAIAKGHATAGAHMRDYETVAMLTGVLLRERKRRLPHGEWGPWLAENFEGSQDTAERYMKLAANSAPVRNLEAISEPISHVEDDAEVIDAEVVDDPDEGYAPPAPSQSEPELDPVRPALVDWFAQGRVVMRALQDTDNFPALSQELRGDVDLMVSIANRVKEVLFK